MSNVGRPALMRGVVMGRREDGAAVRHGPEIRLGSHRVGVTGKPGRRLMRRRGLRGNVTRSSRAMAGLRSQAIRPTARSWLTGVAGPRAESAARASQNAASGAPGGASFRKERGDAFAKRPTGWSRRPSTGGLAHPRVCRRSAPLFGGVKEGEERRTRRRSKNTGDDARPIVIPGRATSPRQSGAARNAPNPESIHRGSARE